MSYFLYYILKTELKMLKFCEMEIVLVEMLFVASKKCSFVVIKHFCDYATSVQFSVSVSVSLSLGKKKSEGESVYLASKILYLVHQLPSLIHGVTWSTVSWLQYLLKIT